MRERKGNESIHYQMNGINAVRERGEEEKTSLFPAFLPLSHYIPFGYPPFVPLTLTD